MNYYKFETNLFVSMTDSKYQKSDNYSFKVEVHQVNIPTNLLPIHDPVST